MTRIEFAILLILAFFSPAAHAAQEASKPPAENPKADGLPLSLSYRDGLQFKTDDGAFQATLGGRLLAHYRTFVERPEQPAGRTAPDTLYLRQARIDFQGKLYQQFDFRLYLDFPTGNAAVAGTIQDAYLGWSGVPEFTVKVGQFKEPISQEQTTTLRATDFVERSVLDRLAPGRDLGVLFSGKVAGGLFEYDLGAFDGAGRAVTDNSDEKDVAGRLRVSPFARTAEGNFFKGLRLGVSGSFGDVDSVSLAGAGGTALDLTTTELQIQFLDSTAGVIDGRRTRVGAEFSWLWESLGLRAEWLRRTDTVTNGAAFDEEEVASSAWNASFTWLLTGEKKVLENRIVPRHPFDLSAGGWGAFEIAVRAAVLKIDHDLYDGGVAARAGNADRVQTFTAGINWYLTRNVRISPNVILEKFNREITSDDEDTFIGVLVRFQIDF